MEENGATVVVYQPQVISWPDHKVLNARAAIEITPRGSRTPILGTLEVAAETQTDFDTRSVILTEPKLVSSRFPTLDTEQAAQLDSKINAAIPNMRVTSVPIDTVLLSLKNATAQVQAPELNNDPPAIFYSSRPASLVVFHGELVLAPLEKTPLYAVNTNWTVLTDTATRSPWYLLNNGAWLQAPAYSGPYAPAAKLPAGFQTIPNDGGFRRSGRTSQAGRSNPARRPSSP